MIRRINENSIKNAAKSKKVVVLLGARQTGKTTLLKDISSGADSCLWLNGDELDVQNLFATMSAQRFKSYLGTKSTVVIDEAQRIPDIGLRLKLIATLFPKFRFLQRAAR